jgi:hypothetical protein
VVSSSCVFIVIVLTFSAPVELSDDRNAKQNRDFIKIQDQRLDEDHPNWPDFSYHNTPCTKNKSHSPRVPRMLLTGLASTNINFDVTESPKSPLAILMERYNSSKKVHRLVLPPLLLHSIFLDGGDDSDIPPPSQYAAPSPPVLRTAKVFVNQAHLPSQVGGQTPAPPQTLNVTYASVGTQTPWTVTVDQAHLSSPILPAPLCESRLGGHTILGGPRDEEKIGVFVYTSQRTED